MSRQRTLQKLNELREVVDGDMEEMIDTMASLVVLKQDISQPMLGAKITIWELPDGEWVECNQDSYDGLDESSNLWRALKTGEDIKHQRYMEYEEKGYVEDKDEIPDIFNPDDPLEEDIERARKDDAEWEVFERGYVRIYKKKKLVPADSLVGKKGIVYEANVADAPDGTYWDPNEQEYKEPSDYPMGTVNAVVPDYDNKQFGKDYVCDIEDKTSLQPARGDPSPHSYTPGWE